MSEQNKKDVLGGRLATTTRRVVGAGAANILYLYVYKLQTNINIRIQQEMKEEGLLVRVFV
jgi:hypothetical protein